MRSALLESANTQHIEQAAAQKWAVYNAKMAELFADRNMYPMDSPEREAAAQAILALWVAEG
jgi:hypothetical protein